MEAADDDAAAAAPLAEDAQQRDVVLAEALRLVGRRHAFGERSHLDRLEVLELQRLVPPEERAAIGLLGAGPLLVRAAVAVRRERRHEDVLEILHLLHADHVGVQRDRRRQHARQPQLGAQRVGGARTVVLRVAREQRLREHVVRREAQRRRRWSGTGGAAADN